MSTKSATIPSLFEFPDPENDSWLDTHEEYLFKLQDRLNLIDYYEADVLPGKTINVIGTGGLGYAIAVLLGRKLVHKLRLFDHDEVEISNLNRCFAPQDIGRNKANALARHLQKTAIAPITIEAYPNRFESVAMGKSCDLRCDLAIVAIDNNLGRLYASDYFREQQTPAIFIAVDGKQVDSGYLFLQTSRMGDPCWGCAIPHSTEASDSFQCVGSDPSLNTAIAGMVGYLVDCVLGARPMVNWNYFELFLDGKLNGGGPALKSAKAACESCGRYSS